MGRQGTFPHGIDVITAADYFAVGSRINAYLKLSVFVAGFEEYTDCLVDHLVNENLPSDYTNLPSHYCASRWEVFYEFTMYIQVEKKVGHWDIAVREIAASALHNLSPVCPERMRSVVLPRLARSAESPSVDLFLRHGSIVAVGFVVSALGGVAKEEGKSLREYLGDDLISSVSQIGVSLVQRLSLRVSGGGDLLRQAIASHIEQCAEAAFPVHGTDIVDLWQAILGECA